MPITIVSPKATTASLRQAYNFSPQMAKDGVWTPLAGGEVLLAREGNPNHAIAIEAASAPFRTLLSQNKATPAIVREITAKAASEAILLDWRGFDEPYSRHASYNLMIDQPDFLDDIMALSRARERFRTEDTMDAVPSS